MGRGIVAREKGQKFTEKLSGKSFDFDHIELFPSDGSKEYKTNAELLAAIDKFYQDNPTVEHVKDVNRSDAGKKAAIIAVLKDEKEDELVSFVRYLRNVSPTGGFGQWRDSIFAKDTGLERKGSQVDIETLPFKPGDLVQVGNVYSPGDAIAAIKASLTNLVTTGVLDPEVEKQLQDVLSSIEANKKPEPIMTNVENCSSITKYFGEVISPLALTKNWLVAGDYEKAERFLLPNESFSACMISWPAGSQNSLYDSLLVSPSGRKIKVGTKRKVTNSNTGAAASIVGLMKLLSTMETEAPELFKKNKRVYDLLNIVVGNSAVMGILMLAEQFGMLLPDDITTFIGLYKNVGRNGTLDNVMSQLSSQLRATVAGIPFKTKNTDPYYKPEYHVLASIAKAVSKQINSLDIFDEAARDALNFVSYIQADTVVGTSKTSCTFLGFVVKFPPEFDGEIIADASKNYFATQPPKGKLTFKMI